jgi:putative hemolysin
LGWDFLACRKIGLPFRVIDRSTAWKLDGTASLHTCSAEDLLVMKSFAGRDKDWADVTSVLERRFRQILPEREELTGQPQSRMEAAGPYALRLVLVDTILNRGVVACKTCGVLTFG